MEEAAETETENAEGSLEVGMRCISCLVFAFHRGWVAVVRSLDADADV
jgi:hypothetical protein